MKLSSMFVTAVVFLLASCYFENKIQSQGAKEARDTQHEMFIEMESGEIVSYSKLKIKSPPLQYQYLEGDGKKINTPAKEIRAFQTENYYAIKVYNQAELMIGKLPFSELYAARIVDGKIELFVISEKKKDAYGPNESGYAKSYFIRKGKKTLLIPATAKSLKNMISDNKSLFEDFDNIYKRTYPFKSIMKVLEEYN